VDVPGQTIIENEDGTQEIQGTASRSTDQSSNGTSLGLSISSSGGFGGGGPGGGGGGGSGDGTNGTRQAQSQTQPDPRCQKPLPGNSTVTKNVNFLRQLTYMSGGQGAPFVAWLLNVAPGGKWDYKQSGQPGSEMMGNFNFGATGSDFFSPTTLLSGAGIVQLLTLPSNSSGGIPFVMPPYGDESGDQIDIQAGIDAGC
jgi:hypothetical protein